MTVLVIFIIGVITGVIIYADKVAPFSAPVLVVDDSEVSMGYFLKRAAVSFSSPSMVLQNLIAEQIIKLAAPNIPYSIKVSDTDVENAIREIAKGALELDDGAVLTENDFDTWYKQELKNSGFSDAEYRDKMRVDLLGAGLNTYLAERIPTVAEQVKLYIITLKSDDEAETVIGRLDAGEDFVEVAEELKADNLLAMPDIDLGWLTRDALSTSFATVAFDYLEVGEHSAPLFINQQYYAIIKLEDRAKARQVDEELLEVLRQEVFSSWLQQEITYHNIAVHGINNGYDQETEAWITYQLQKIRRKD